MVRKYDRYGRNRQFRRNPTRSRKFFPYQLPFQRDFRLNIKEDATAMNWRKQVEDSNKRKLGKNSDVSDFDEDDVFGLYQRMQHLTQSPPLRQIGRDLRYGVEGMIIGEMPLAAIPLAGAEMIMNPKKVSKRFGGGVIATSVGFGILGAKNLI